MGRFDNYKFHPSSLGKIMTSAKSGEGLGETCKAHLLECWIEATYGRKKDITNKYIEKGTLVEEDAITLYSLVTKTFYKKNKETIENEFLIGTPDLFLGPEIRKATSIKDIKSSWDIFTFHSVMSKPMNKDYDWQLQGYSDLTGANDLGLVYCLVDTPLHLINDAKRKLQWTMGVIDPDVNHEYIEQCEQIEKNMTFGDIPKEKRYIEFSLKRDNKKIEEAKEKMLACRKFLNELQ